MLLFTAFLDSVALLMIVPLLPFHATGLGGGGAVVGLLMATVPLVQLVSAPVWGRLSDRVGRKPVLLIGMTAAVVASVLLALADSLPGLFLSRVVQGVGGGTVGVLQAYVVDVTRPEARAQALGRVSAATSLGVMLGPALGALGASLGPAMPGLFAAGLGACNVLLAARFLPEAPGVVRAASEGRSSGKGDVLRVLSHPREPLARLVWTYVLAMGAFQGGTAVLSLLLASRFGLTARTVGWVYLFTGAVAVVARALLLGRAVARLGELRLWRWGVVLLGMGLVLLA
ncbi:MFS transporter, partial [Corallococcus sp. CA047B]|uniref:MFS transporter n=1 Tax=Corallococcus sp. CA047B TaxID=2316729 RepID=UPI000EF0882D